jgi:hypothetical protein
VHRKEHAEARCEQRASTRNVAKVREKATSELDAAMTTQSNDFRAALRKRFLDAQRRGQSTLDVSAADLCREAGRQSEDDAAACCAVMRAAMGLRDRIVESPSKGDGDTLTVRYMLPHTRP